MARRLRREEVLRLSEMVEMLGPDGLRKEFVGLGEQTPATARGRLPSRYVFRLADATDIGSLVVLILSPYAGITRTGSGGQ